MDIPFSVIWTSTRDSVSLVRSKLNPHQRVSVKCWSSATRKSAVSSAKNASVTREVFCPSNRPKIRWSRHFFPSVRCGDFFCVELTNRAISIKDAEVSKMDEWKNFATVIVQIKATRAREILADLGKHRVGFVGFKCCGNKQIKSMSRYSNRGFKPSQMSW